MATPAWNAGFSRHSDADLRDDAAGWSADLRSASRGSAKPASIVLLYGDVGGRAQLLWGSVALFLAGITPFGLAASCVSRPAAAMPAGGRRSEASCGAGGVTPCAARSAARAGLETGVPSRGCHPGRVWAGPPSRRDGRAGSFRGEERPFALESPAIPAEATVSPQHAVAGHQHRDAVRRAGGSHGAGRLGPFDS